MHETVGLLLHDIQLVCFVGLQVEKSLMTKAPPANAFKSAPVALQKPPFPVRQKLADIGPEFIDPPVDAGPPKKSFASLFGSGDRSIPAAHHEANSKPLAMIHPTVHNNVNAVAPRMQNCVSGGKEQSVSFPPMVKVRPEKLSVDDYDINLQRLGGMSHLARFYLLQYCVLGQQGERGQSRN